jgi:general stress protein 26
MAEPEAERSRDGNTAKIGEFIKDIDFTMMTTVDEAGELQSRPMSTQKAEFDGDVYFFTFDDSSKIKHIKANPRVNLAYSQPEKMNFVSLKGDAEISKDRAKMEELWSPELKAWFPEGLNTPGITLIKVSVKSAEYWDSPSSFVAHIVGLVKSTLTGKSPQAGDDVTVELKN